LTSDCSWLEFPVIRFSLDWQALLPRVEKGKENKGKERKGKERKGKER
jgi:hypothetical protein